MVEGVLLGAHWVAVAMDLVEQVSRLVQAVITDVHVLLFHILRPTCKRTKLVSVKSGFKPKVVFLPKYSIKVQVLALFYFIFFTLPTFKRLSAQIKGQIFMQKK